MFKQIQGREGKSREGRGRGRGKRVEEKGGRKRRGGERRTAETENLPYNLKKESKMRRRERRKRLQCLRKSHLPHAKLPIVA